MPLINHNCLCFSFWGPPQSGTVTVASVLPIGKEVVGIVELWTAAGVFEVLAGGVLGAAANLNAAFGIVSFCRNSSGSPPACGR